LSEKLRARLHDIAVGPAGYVASGFAHASAEAAGVPMVVSDATLALAALARAAWHDGSAPLAPRGALMLSDKLAAPGDTSTSDMLRAVITLQTDAQTRDAASTLIEVPRATLAQLLARLLVHGDANGRRGAWHVTQLLGARRADTLPLVVDALASVADGVHAAVDAGRAWPHAAVRVALLSVASAHAVAVERARTAGTPTRAVTERAAARMLLIACHAAAVTAEMRRGNESGVRARPIGGIARLWRRVSALLSPVTVDRRFVADALVVNERSGDAYGARAIAWRHAAADALGVLARCDVIGVPVDKLSVRSACACACVCACVSLLMALRRRRRVRC
jgi:hypothetical protein